MNALEDTRELASLQRELSSHASVRALAHELGALITQMLREHSDIDLPTIRLSEIDGVIHVTGRRGPLTTTECPSCHTTAGHPHTDYCQAPNLTAEVDGHCHRCEGAGCKTCTPNAPLHVMSCDECGADLDVRSHFIGCTQEP